MVGVITAAAFETIAVATAMPTAVRDVGGLTAYAWAFNGVVLATLVATVFGGVICDRRGPRAPLFGGLGVFMVGLVVCALAQTMPVFVAGRVLQGLGGGAAIVAVYVLVARGFDPAMRPQVFSVLAGAWVVPSLVGPFIAGLITTVVGWRWVFVSVVPLVLLALWAVGPLTRAVDGPPAGPTSGGGTARLRQAGQLALGAALVMDGGLRWGVLGGIEVLAGLLLMLPALRTLLPPGTLRLARGLPAGISARGLLAGSFFGAQAFVPLMLDDQRNVSVTMAGLALTTSSIGWFAGSYWQGRPSLRINRTALVAVGAVCVAISIVGMAAAVVAPFPAALAAVTWTLGGFGMGITVPAVNVLVLGGSAPAEQGANSAALQLGDGVGVLLCTALAGAVYATSAAPSGEQQSTFILLFLVMAAVAAVAIVAALRLLPSKARHDAAQDAAPGDAPSAAVAGVEEAHLKAGDGHGITD